MAAIREPRSIRLAAGLAAAVAGLVLLWVFPPLRIVPLNSPAVALEVQPGSPAFDAGAVAARIWTTDLRAAAQRAVRLESFAAQLQADPMQARKKHAHSSGLGPAYYFVRGSGTVVGRDPNHVRLALDGADGVIVQLRTGPVFGNTVRDGCGLLDVNAYPGLEAFNALAAALNALVENEVLPGLRTYANQGVSISFAGCAEAPETSAGPDEPILTVVPVQAEMQR